MSVFATQYARALADAVMSDKLGTQAIDGQLRDFVGTLRDSKELRGILGNPSVPLDTKLKVLDAIAPRIGMAKQLRNFLAVVLQNDRMHALESIAVEYRKEIDARLHIVEAVVTSVRELNAEQRSGMEAKASQLAGFQVRAAFKKDASLLGGVVLRIGDTIYDGSVRGRLEELRDKLIAK
ncbi:MAG: ATP synthase F1 subunit delta [Acidobacteriaceae bacterium]